MVPPAEILLDCGEDPGFHVTLKLWDKYTNGIILEHPPLCKSMLLSPQSHFREHTHIFVLGSSFKLIIRPIQGLPIGKRFYYTGFYYTKEQFTQKWKFSHYLLTPMKFRRQQNMSGVSEQISVVPFSSRPAESNPTFLNWFKKTLFMPTSDVSVLMLS